MKHLKYINERTVPYVVSNSLDKKGELLDTIVSDLYTESFEDE